MRYGVDTGFLVAAEMVEHQNHLSARNIITTAVKRGDQFALTPQVLSEFIHVVTDPKRFIAPLHMDAARQVARSWWTAGEVTQIFPTDATVPMFFEWHQYHRLGRKRILDTFLAATYRTVGIDTILTTNADDFVVFGGFQCLVP